MNPWRQGVLGLLRNIIRFSLWVALAVNGVLLAIFSIRFTRAFVNHLWTWCDRVLFPGTW